MTPTMFERTLLDRCDVLRPTMAEDRYGQSVPVGEEAVYEAVPCRLIRARRWVYQNDTAQGAIVEEYKLVLLATYDVRKADVVQIGGSRYSVASAVLRRDHHLTVELERRD